MVLEGMLGQMEDEDRKLPAGRRGGQAVHRLLLANQIKPEGAVAAGLPVEQLPLAGRLQQPGQVLGGLDFSYHGEAVIIQKDEVASQGAGVSVR